MTTAVLPGAISRCGAVATNSPRRRRRHGTDAPTRTRRRDGPHAARAAGAHRPATCSWTANGTRREPSQSGAGTRTRGPAVPRPRSPEREDPTAARTAPRGTQCHRARSRAGPFPAGSPEHRPPQRPSSRSPSSPSLAFSPPAPSAAGPEATGLLSAWTRPHVLQNPPQWVLKRPVLVPVDSAHVLPKPPQRVLRKTGFLVWTRAHVLPNPPQRVLRRPGSCPCGDRVLVPVDAGPRLPESPTVGPKEAGFLSVWTQHHVLPKPQQWVLRRPSSCPCGRGPASPRPPESPLVGPEEAELLPRRRRAERACACARRRQEAGLGRPLQAVEVVQDSLGSQVRGGSAPSWPPAESMTFWKLKWSPLSPNLAKNS